MSAASSVSLAQRIQFDQVSPHLMLEDEETDDLVAISLYENTPLLVAEKHPKRGSQRERTEGLLEALGKDPSQVVKGGEESVPSLIEALNKLPDQSLLVTITAPCPTLEALIAAAPDLLAKKIKRIVALGGFTKRICEFGTNSGKDCYYTSYNLSTNIPAAKALFTFVEKRNIPCYILATDRLKLDRRLNDDLPKKIQKLDIPASRYLIKDMHEWNKISTKGQLRPLSMTPADPMAAIFGEAFESLDIDSDRISITITDEPRYEKNNEGQWEKTKHRAAELDFSKTESSIHFVKGFRLKGTNLDSTQTFEVLFDQSLNRLYKQQGVSMSVSATSSSSSLTHLLPTTSSSATSATAASATKPSTPSVSLVTPPAKLPSQISIELLAKENPEMQMDNPQVATLAQIEAAFEAKDYNKLQDLFKGTVVAEFRAKSYDYSLRCAFLKAFTGLNLSEGRGAESVRIFAKILIPIRLDDPDYAAKIMHMAKGKWHMRPNDRIPGDGEFLSVRCPGMKKTEVPLPEQSLLLPERYALQAKCESEAIEKSRAFRTPLKAHLFYRGIIGSGKSTLAKNLHQLDEDKLVSSDTLKPNLGGNLTHHEACAIMDAVREKTQDLFRVEMKTNVYEGNTEDFVKTKGPKIIHDIYVTAKTAKERIIPFLKNKFIN